MRSEQQLNLAFTYNLDLKIEYLFADFGSDYGPSCGLGLPETIRTKGSIIRAGLNYRFLTERVIITKD